MLLTSKNVVKTISLLVVSIFLFVQVASASHVHTHDHIHAHEYSEEDQSPEPSLCTVCTLSTNDDELNFYRNLPPPSSPDFNITSIFDLEALHLSDVFFDLKRDNINLLEPPNLRLSASRAPPI